MSPSTDATVLLMHATPGAVRDRVGSRRGAGAHAMTSLILRLEKLPARDVVDLAADPGAESTTLGRWSATVAAAQDGCVVLDPQGRVVSVSALAAELLDCADEGVIGRRLLDVISVIDLETGEVDPDYAGRIPPLAAIAGRMVRSLIRIRHDDDASVSLDVSSVPLHDAHGRCVGSLSFVDTI